MKKNHRFAFAPGLLLLAAWLAMICPALGAGLNWPAGQLLPAFSAPTGTVDCIDVSSASAAEIDLFASLEGIVNRAQPRLACVSSADGEGKFTWLNLHNLPYAMIGGYDAIAKYQASVNGLVVTDPNLPDTLNVATTIAGVSNLLICDPILLPTLTNAPYSLPVRQDLRGKFTTKYQAYGWLYTNYWPQCTHRIITGLYPGIHGNLRDYCVAVKSAVVWLDPGPLNPADQSLLALFLNGTSPMNAVYMGWWPSEGNGLNWIAQYGIPVLASDYFRNASLFGGVRRTINVPPIPPPPPLQNKVYVALILSDGDNVQYMQHVMKMRWESSARGSVPIGWTVSPLAAELDPVLMNYYWNTATTNDCLISGPSGAGYAHIENWNPVNLAAMARVSNSYLRRSGLRVITIWDQVTTGVAQAFATNCPALLGLTDQSGGNYTRVDFGLRTVGLVSPYTSFTNDIISAITNAAKNWNGSAPMFLAAQAVTWDLGPTDLKNIADALDPSKYVVVRPDHLFMLADQLAGQPVAVTRGAVVAGTGAAQLQGAAIPNAPTAVAWFEWGTNNQYGSITPPIPVVGSSLIPIKATINGLGLRTVYHFRLAVSNELGVVRGADQIFTTGGRVKVWGDGSLGQTNLPPGLTNAVGISAGAYHGLALRNDGTVAAWGYDGFGQTNVPSGLAGVTAVAAGLQHCLALKADGTVTAWGGDADGQANVPPGLSNVVAIAAGGYHSLALSGAGVVTAWGDDDYGQTSVPAGLSNVVAIAAGRFHSLALQADGAVVAWGNNGAGQTNIPAGLGQVTAIAAGDFHNLALRAGVASANPLPAARWTADSLVGANGSAVSNWLDSVQGTSAAQANAAQQPKLFANVINGHNGVRFSGGQCLVLPAAASPISACGSFTLAVVFQTTTPGNASGNFYLNTGLLATEQPGVVPDWALCLNGSQLGAGLGAGAGGCGADFSLYGGDVTDGHPHIAMYVRSGGTLALYVDGVVVAAQGSLCPAARGDYPVQIGAMAPGLYYFNGDIAEIQIYDRALDARELADVNDDLAATYRIGSGIGPVTAWGSDSSGQTDVPGGLAQPLAAAAGGTFNLTLQADGTVTGWGNNSFGQQNFSPGLTNVSALAGGENFAVAIGNQTPQVSSLSVTGYVNHDLTLALPGSDPDGHSLRFYVQSLPAAGALYQSAAGVRGAPINAPATLVTDPNGRVVFAADTNATGSPYANFNFTAADDFYPSAAAQAAVNVVLPSVPQFSQAAWNAANQSFALGFSGSADAAYSVWASTNLHDWTRLGPASEAGPGLYQFMDPATTHLPQRFYRATAP